MVIRIESLTVENLRRFRGEHQLDLGQRDEASTTVVTGNNALGKTTLAESIDLCLAGEFKDDAPLVTYDLVDQLSPGEEVSGKVEIVIADTDVDRRFHFSRRFQTTETRRGPANSVDTLDVREQQDGEWVATDPSEAVNTVFPPAAFTFSKLDSESTVGINDPWGGTSWTGLLETIAEAAQQQAAAREVDLPEYFETSSALSDEVIRRINSVLGTLDKHERYGRVQAQDGSLVTLREEDGVQIEMKQHSAGGKYVISQAAAMAASGILPATPPLIGDTLFGRVDRPTRTQMFEAIQQANRQVLLFLTNVELEELDATPQFTLEQGGGGRESSIIAAK